MQCWTKTSTIFLRRMFGLKRMRRNKYTDYLVYKSICQPIWFAFMRLSFACFKSLSTCASDRFFKTLRSQIFFRAACSASLCASGSEVCCVLSALSSSPAASWLQTGRELCGPPFAGMKTIGNGGTCVFLAKWCPAGNCMVCCLQRWSLEWWASLLAGRSKWG